MSPFVAFLTEHYFVLNTLVLDQHTSKIRILFETVLLERQATPKKLATMCYIGVFAEICCCADHGPGDFMSNLCKSSFCGLCGKSVPWSTWGAIYNLEADHEPHGHEQWYGGQQQPPGGIPLENAQPQPNQPMVYNPQPLPHQAYPQHGPPHLPQPGPWAIQRRQQIAAGTFRPQTQSYAQGPRPDGTPRWRANWEARQTLEFGPIAPGKGSL